MCAQTNASAEGLTFERLVSLAHERAQRVVWVDSQRVYTWTDLASELMRVGRLCMSSGVYRGGFILTPGEVTWESVCWLLGSATPGVVLVPLRQVRALETGSWMNCLRLDWRVDDDRLKRVAAGYCSETADRLLDMLRVRKHPGLVLATSGTTGIPKVVLHDFASLLEAIPVKTGQMRRVMPLMHLDHIGGLDMVWRALAAGQVVIAPPREFTPESVAASIAQHKVEVMPATPSFLNLMLLAGVDKCYDLRSLKTVPYGAEPMPAGLLVRLRQALPGVEFIQRFGTSETGALPVHDEGEGLRLRGGDTRYAWKVIDGELWIRSPSRALGYLSGGSERFTADGWFRTGDIAEVAVDGSIRILGRSDDVINVGGEKVLPASIEGVLLRHPDVADCRVFGIKSPVLGQVVSADVVWRGKGSDAIAVKQALHLFASGSLPRCHLPAVVHLVPTINASANFKKIRLTNK